MVGIRKEYERRLVNTTADSDISMELKTLYSYEFDGSAGFAKMQSIIVEAEICT